MKYLGSVCSIVVEVLIIDADFHIRLHGLKYALKVREASTDCDQCNSAKGFLFASTI